MLAKSLCGAMDDDHRSFEVRCAYLMALEVRLGFAQVLLALGHLHIIAVRDPPRAPPSD